jgi:hypothetical protein
MLIPSIGTEGFYIVALEEFSARNKQYIPDITRSFKLPIAAAVLVEAEMAQRMNLHPFNSSLASFRHQNRFALPGLTHL